MKENNGKKSCHSLIAQPSAVKIKSLKRKFGSKLECVQYHKYLCWHFRCPVWQPTKKKKNLAWMDICFHVKYFIRISIIWFNHFFTNITNTYGKYIYCGTIHFRRSKVKLSLLFKLHSISVTSQYLTTWKMKILYVHYHIYSILERFLLAFYLYMYCT